MSKFDSNWTYLSNYLRTFRSTIVPVTQKDTKYLVKHPIPEIVKTVECGIRFLGLNMSSLRREGGSRVKN